MRRSLIGMTATLALVLASSSNAFALTLRPPTTDVLRPILSTSSSSSTSSSAVSSASSKSSSAMSSSSSMSSLKPIKNLKSKSGPLGEYCAAIKAAMTKGEKVTLKDSENQARLDQTMDLLKKANALCGAMKPETVPEKSSTSSSQCAPDGFMGVKGTCDGKPWSTGGVCMSKSFWEGQVTQQCKAPANISYEKPCMTQANKCSAPSSSSATSSTSSACSTEGFMGAKILCSGKPMSSGGVCKPKTYWEAWAKQTCTGFTGFEVQVPCTAACVK